MFEMAIDKAKKSKLFNDIIISTNDDEIAKISQNKGINTYIRSEENSNDVSTTISAVQETANWLIKTKKIQKNQFKKIIICCLYPCTPFVKISFLDESYKLIIHNKDKFVYPVCAFNHPFERRMTMNENKIMHFEEPLNVNKRTQDCKKYFFDAGQFYWGFIEKWLISTQMHSNSYGYDLSHEILYDIDTLNDFKRAEIIYESINRKDI